MNAIAWFPNLNSGLPQPVQTHIEALITAAWKLAVDGRALVEDVEGGEGEQPLVAVLKLRMAEFLVQIDLILRGLVEVDDDHLLSLALEHGLSEVARIDGSELAQVLALGAVDDMPFARISALWNDLLAAFPGEVPNPLRADGQGPILRALRSWSKLCRAARVDDAFLTPLIKAI